MYQAFNNPLTGPPNSTEVNLGVTKIPVVDLGPALMYH